MTRWDSTHLHLRDNGQHCRYMCIKLNPGLISCPSLDLLCTHYTSINYDLQALKMCKCRSACYSSSSKAKMLGYTILYFSLQTQY